jgi:hypothetical protein
VRALIGTFGAMRWIVVSTTLAIVLISISQPFVISSFYRSVFSRGMRKVCPGCWCCC